MKERRKLAVGLRERPSQFKTREWGSLRKGNYFWCTKNDQRIAGAACLSRQERTKGRSSDEIPDDLLKCRKCPQGQLVKALMEHKNGGLR
jgi:hypothetical protein